MIELNSTLGAALLGCLAAAILYGVTSIQTLIYFQGEAKDGWKFQSGIFALWVLDTLHTVLTSHAIYFYLILNFGHFRALEAPIWSLVINIYITVFSDFIVRGYFAMRVYNLCGNQRLFLKIIFSILIAILSVLTSIPGIGFASRAFQLKTFERVGAASTYLYVSLVSTVAVESTIAISLCALLFQSRTGVKRTDSILRILMTYSINTGLLTCIAALACLITYTIWPNKFIYIGFYLVTSKLYVNSLLASLNARASLRKKDTLYNSPESGTRPSVTTLHFTMRDRSAASSFGTATTNDESCSIGLNIDAGVVDEGQQGGGADDSGRKHSKHITDLRTPQV